MKLHTAVAYFKHRNAITTKKKRGETSAAHYANSLRWLNNFATHLIRVKGARHTNTRIRYNIEKKRQRLPLPPFFLLSYRRLYFVISRARNLSRETRRGSRLWWRIMHRRPKIIIAAAAAAAARGAAERRNRAPSYVSSCYHRSILRDPVFGFSCVFSPLYFRKGVS